MMLPLGKPFLPRKKHAHSLVSRPEFGIQYTHTHVSKSLWTIKFELDTHIAPLSQEFLLEQTQIIIHIPENYLG